MTLLKKILTDLKTYYKINAIYPKRYKDSKIDSYIVNENILGKELIIKKNVYIDGTLKSVGDFSYIGDGTEIFNCSKIGKYCSISHNVKIGLDNHNLNFVSTNSIFCSKEFKFKTIASTIIGNDVLISANAMIMSGVTIGNGAIIAAGAFVNKDVPSYAIVAGMPAKIIRYRFDEKTIQKLLESKWWDLPENELQKLYPYFNNVDLFLEKNKIKQLTNK